MEEWKKIERKVHNFSESPEFVGKLKGTTPNDYGKHDFVFEVDGADVIVFGKTALLSKMEGIRPGTNVKIVFTGEKRSTKNPKYSYEDFDVFVKE